MGRTSASNKSNFHFPLEVNKLYIPYGCLNFLPPSIYEFSTAICVVERKWRCRERVISHIVIWYMLGVWAQYTCYRVHYIDWFCITIQRSNKSLSFYESTKYFLERKLYFTWLLFLFFFLISLTQRKWIFKWFNVLISLPEVPFCWNNFSVLQGRGYFLNTAPLIFNFNRAH